MYDEYYDSYEDRESPYTDEEDDSRSRRQDCWKCKETEELMKDAFKVVKWIHDPIIYKRLVANGFKWKTDMNREEKDQLIEKLCKDNNIETLRVMLESKVPISIDSVIEHIKDEQVDFIDCFKESGRDLHVGMLSLHMAIQRKLFKVVRYLQENGAEISNETMKLTGSFQDKKVIEEVMRGIPNPSPWHYTNILHGFLQGSEGKKSFWNNPVFIQTFEFIISMLVSLGADINALMMEEEHWHFTEKKTLVERILGIGSHKINDVMLSKMFTILVASGLDVNKCYHDNCNILVLCICIKEEFIKTKNVLIEAGCDVNSTDRHGTPAFHLNLEAENIPQNFTQKNYSFYCRMIPARVAYTRLRGIFDQWLNRNVDVNCTDKSGLTTFDKLFSRGETRGTQLLYLLFKSELKINTTFVKQKDLKQLNFGALSCLILAGCRDSALMDLVWQAADCESRVQFLRLASPLESRSKLGYDSAQTFPSLPTLCVHTIHQHLFLKVTRGKSVIPRLLKLADSLPKPLARMLMFAEYLTLDPDISGLMKYLLPEQEQEDQEEASAASSNISNISCTLSTVPETNTIFIHPDNIMIVPLSSDSVVSGDAVEITVVDYVSIEAIDTPAD